MENSSSKVAVVGSGISGAVCASSLARNGVSVTIFDFARGPGGRMSQRREISEDGMELYFDHGAPFFAVTNHKFMDLVCEWEARGLVAEWKENFGVFDFMEPKFIAIDKEESNRKYVGIPGMSSVCKALCSEPGVKAKFGIGVGTFQWLETKKSWLLIDFNGEILGEFNAVVASDVYTVSPRFTAVTGKPPPLDVRLVPELASKLQEVPMLPCFSLMLAFSEPLLSILVRGFSFKNSNVLSWAFCDSSKPGRSTTSQCWVLHSTTEYAKGVISKTGLQMLPSSTLSNIAEELFQEFQRTELNIPRPFFMRAHRWYTGIYVNWTWSFKGQDGQAVTERLNGTLRRDTAFSLVSVAGNKRCLADTSKRLVICGDFCVSPDVEGATLSGMGAAAKVLDVISIDNRPRGLLSSNK